MLVRQGLAEYVGVSASRLIGSLALVLQKGVSFASEHVAVLGVLAAIVILAVLRGRKRR
ncbi:MAG: hypothetical protein L0271_02525 [Gemmatimonadetes bacterium]|nr:hypothetical protein [Gemmatimonadota bacterium]